MRIHCGKKGHGILRAVSREPAVPRRAFRTVSGSMLETVTKGGPAAWIVDLPGTGSMIDGCEPNWPSDRQRRPSSETIASTVEALRVLFLRTSRDQGLRRGFEVQLGPESVGLTIQPSEHTRMDTQWRA